MSSGYISLDRWRAAQVAEAKYWYSTNTRQHAARRAEEHARALWVAELLDIRPETVRGRAVLDIGGGPQPIVAWPELALGRRVLVDPMPLDAADTDALGSVTCITGTAEHYEGEPCDEVWGYNVLQHVLSPARVLHTATTHARRIRWFEWTHQPISVVHPHVVTAATFDVLAGWRRVVWQDGVRDEGRGWNQSYVAGVWEAP